ncbi:hypothetical protein [Streptomyces sp. CC210A]|uniref:hypothetical protein n=1 Tax=Streptomyces sp. CC210A TaxID=2898184 RepID=UPI001F26D544|nr:hypothetical protein [Streptomyces sp. CC210A]
MNRMPVPTDAALAKYAARLDEAHRSWPSWRDAWADGPTHVEMFWWHHDSAGWIGDKSNFEVARDLIREAADEGCLDTENSDEHVCEFGGGSSAWDVGQLFVQVYEGGCPPDCPGPHADECRPWCGYAFDEHDRAHGRRVGVLVREGDFRCYDCVDTCAYEREAEPRDAGERCTYCKGRVYLPPAAIAELAAEDALCFGAECEGDCHGSRTYTAAFRAAVALAEYIEHDHPFLNEDDYYEQRREEFEKNLAEVLQDIKLHYPYDSEADHQSTVEHASQRLWDLSDYEPDGYADWDDAREAYDYGRTEHFLNLGREFMRNEIPGQLALVA